MQTTAAASRAECDLRVAAQMGAGGMALGYEFRNRSGQVAFLFNVLHRGGAGDANLIYAQAQGGALTLSKKIIAVPRDIEVEKPDVPYVTRVGPGEAFREKLDVAVPVKLWAPYPGAAGRAPEGAELEVWFEVGFFLTGDAGVAREAGGRLVIYPFAAEKQIVLRAGPLGRVAVRG